ncbi:hypothetical protein COV53_04500 [Candidatus Gottesmanbacteria bacterium CG11_big_fil_rev_8_21_14_0_20_37_11]|uniref:Glycosyltransferase RgtA/B/C/D-like domain-containing protein n=2 Tax=Candidatus Gottesmaniibacteriota TaxID=1752720 RepID=A0A2M7RPH3_9BACT|nr:MAG: hypothetical protein COX23_00935 [Candidatus Gottesmanbacteria bacterium CG23_combo_of_CG06-09_8_20_14_all_37_19]PIR08141.1 MAG: hypothetical protein COV53_04500 [Candidatus Gottesmanbacteria bacterium CG11_big_fil_rev_8_21_14_0_20_37_11]PIZ02172.1 MAG: hypothetical protein COY59_06120 [Candidatus Gottesmanbacteria bacterium CG_4_10_14_0_8_um_filter_37_24]
MNKILLIIILILSLYYRFWDAPHRYGIGGDGSRDALVAFEAIRQIQLPATGPFSSIGPITFGPWYYYLNILSSIVIPSPWAPWIGIGIASLGMVIVMYRIGVLLNHTKLGLILALLAASSPAQISSSTNLQPHALIGFLTSLVLYIFIQLAQEKENIRLFTLWGFIIGVSILTHYQTVGLLTLPILYFLLNRRIIFLLRFLFGFIISLIPTLFFELNNHWFNLRNIIDYLRFGQYRVWTSNRWLTYAGKFWPEFWSFVIGTPFAVSLFFMTASIIILSVIFFKKRKATPLFLILISFLIEVVILRYYRGEKFFGYLQFFHPYIYIITGYVFLILSKTLKYKFILFTLIAIYIILTIPNSLKHMQYDPLNSDTRIRIDTLKNNIASSKFSTYYCTKVYDKDRVQALLLMLYMNKMYDENGYKIAISNPACHSSSSIELSNNIIDVNNSSEGALLSEGIIPLSPRGIYNEVARWWMDEKP